MPTVNDLERATDAFLELHWPSGTSRPRWSTEPWRFVGTLRNGDARGCYAFLRGDTVTYVGLGAGRNPGRYEGAGLGARLSRCWRYGGEKDALGQRVYRRAEGYEDVDAIITIPLVEYPYLACALEAYLIRELTPERNRIGNPKPTPPADV
jgi:hypothetical protein